MIQRRALWTRSTRDSKTACRPAQRSVRLSLLFFTLAEAFEGRSSGLHSRFTQGFDFSHLCWIGQCCGRSARSWDRTCLSAKARLRGVRVQARSLVICLNGVSGKEIEVQWRGSIESPYRGREDRELWPDLRWPHRPLPKKGRALRSVVEA